MQIVSVIVIFFILYVIAFISNIHYREDDDIFFISKSQWEGIFIMILPTLIAIFMR